MALSKKDFEELRPVIDRTVSKFLGFSEPTLVTAAISCLEKGYDKRKTVDKLSDILDGVQALKFSDRLFAAFDEFKLAIRDRSTKPKVKDAAPAISKAPGGMGLPTLPPGLPAGVNAALLNVMYQVPPALSSVIPDNSLASRAAELQARIQSRMSMVKLGDTSITAPTSSGPTPLILDSEGRTIDAKTGQTIQLQQLQPTLKANIRAKKREQFKAVHEKASEEITDSKFFDPRVSIKGAQRGRRNFKFHEKGKFEQLAQRLRTKAQLEKLQSEIAQAAKKTGIASAAKLATIQPKKDLAADHIPDVEWWDSVILQSDSYDVLQRGGGNVFDCITHLVEHPIQMKPPAEDNEPVKITVMLTKDERKKLRRQSRTEAQKELQEKIRLGLIPPPEPKVRMANLMRVLGTEAVQDPTKVEAHVRAQMVKRQRQHEEANANRKLTKEQRREKKMKKLKEDTSLGVHVSVYRVFNLSNPAKKFKVETNANQLFMTGIVVLYKDCNVIVVEGGPKQQKKFRKLVLHRIKWSEDPVNIKDSITEAESSQKRVNACHLVWEGTTRNRAFGEMKFKMCPTETFAREIFKKHDVEQYWDLAYSMSILEAATS